MITLQAESGCHCYEAIAVIKLVQDGMAHACLNCVKLETCDHPENLAYRTLGFEIAHQKCLEALGRMMANVMHDANPIYRKWEESSEVGQENMKGIIQQVLDQPYFKEYFAGVKCLS
jgi:hypothetical protein